MPGPDANRMGTSAPASEAEAVALAFLQAAGDDRWAALVRLAEEALCALDQADALREERERLISRGYVRGAA